jgi:hypothetical protein
MALIRYVLFIVEILAGAFEAVISWIVKLSGSLYSSVGQKMLVRLVRENLERVKRLLQVGQRYLQHVRRTLQYRLHYQKVTDPMTARYRELRRG